MFPEITLDGYATLVEAGDWLIVADTIFADLAGTPVGQASEKYPDVAQSNPRAAIARFLGGNPSFKRMSPPYDYGPGNFLDGFLQRNRE